MIDYINPKPAIAWSIVEIVEKRLASLGYTTLRYWRDWYWGIEALRGGIASSVFEVFMRRNGEYCVRWAGVCGSDNTIPHIVYQTLCIEDPDFNIEKLTEKAVKDIHYRLSSDMVGFGR